jgi:hypothetical protein
MQPTFDAAKVERWFIRRGVPHFIEDYSAVHDIFTRAAGLLTLIALVEVLLALSFSAWWANALAVLGGLALVLGGWAVLNRWRGRPPLARPTSVGRIEVVAFVLLPALVPAVFGGDLGRAGGVVAVNLGLLGLIYVVTSYGVIPISRWAVIRAARELGSTLMLFARAVPLLLLFVTFLFINAELWQVAAGLEGVTFVGTLGLLGAAGAVFLLARLPREVAGLGRFESREALMAACAGTPVAGLVAGDGPPPPQPSLSRRQWANVGLMVLFGQAVQILLVAVLVGAFLVLLGLLVMRDDVILAWTQNATTTTLGPAVTLFERRFQLTEELLRVAGFLAAFSGLYFAVTAVIDQSYREEFFEPVVDEVRQAFGVREVYLTELDAAT